jgi:hypothetical protein
MPKRSACARSSLVSPLVLAQMPIEATIDAAPITAQVVLSGVPVMLSWLST